MNRKRPKPFIIKMSKVGERILKAEREKIATISRFFSRNITCQKGVAWHIQSAEKEKFPTKIVYPIRLLFRIEGEIKNFSNEQKLRVHQY